MGGYLQYFRGYRIQLSHTAEGVGDNGSSSAVIHHHFRNVQENCIVATATKFIHLVGLAHVGEALSGRTGSGHSDVIQEIKKDPKTSNEFMEHLLTLDFGQDTNYAFSMEDTLAHLESGELQSLDQLENIKYLEGVDEGSVSIAYGTMGTSAVVVDARTLKGYSLDFKDFEHTDTEFMCHILLYLVSLKEEYPRLLPPHFYVNKKRSDSIQPEEVME